MEGTQTEGNGLTFHRSLHERLTRGESVLRHRLRLFVRATIFHNHLKLGLGELFLPRSHHSLWRLIFNLLEELTKKIFSHKGQLVNFESLSQSRTDLFTKDRSTRSAKEFDDFVLGQRAATFDLGEIYREMVKLTVKSFPLKVWWD